jgi:hypothetical protein
MSRRPFLDVFSSERGSTPHRKFRAFFPVPRSTIGIIRCFISGIMPPSTVPAPSKSQIRNQKRKHARQLQSIHSTIQKNHTARIEKELVVSNDVLKKTAGELARVKNANDRLQVIAQSATLDAHIFKRSAENHATKLVEKDRIIASLSAVAATAGKSPP